MDPRTTNANNQSRFSVVPIHDKLFGKVLPSMQEIAASLTEKEHVKIMTTGQYALNKIGLSSQVLDIPVILTPLGFGFPAI